MNNKNNNATLKSIIVIIAAFPFFVAIVGSLYLLWSDPDLPIWNLSEGNSFSNQPDSVKESQETQREFQFENQERKTIEEIVAEKIKNVEESSKEARERFNSLKPVE